MNRYEATGPEGEYQPGSNSTVLLNQPGITDADEMDDLELELLFELYDEVLRHERPDRRLTVADLKRWHHRWLGQVYDWAGQERSVNISKDGFPFAVVTQLPALLATFETEILARFTPCHFKQRDDVVRAIAKTHLELILIHPFREGNGRLARLLADVMSFQAGAGLLNYQPWQLDGGQRYFAAIQAGMGNDYGPMERLVVEAMD